MDGHTQHNSNQPNFVCPRALQPIQLVAPSRGSQHSACNVQSGPVAGAYLEGGRTKPSTRIRKSSTWLKAWRAYRSCWAAEAPGALVASVSGHLERVP